MSKYKKPV